MVDSKSQTKPSDIITNDLQTTNLSTKRGRDSSDSTAVDQSLDQHTKRHKNDIKFAPTRETDMKKVEGRLKQIKYGKNTIGYDNYIASVPKHCRKGWTEHPRTPDPYEVQSKRCFDGRIKVWRRELHKWDNTSTKNIAPFLDSNETLEDVINRRAYIEKQTSINTIIESNSTSSDIHILDTTNLLPTQSHITEDIMEEDYDLDDIL